MCPLCNSEATLDSLVRNHQLDAVVVKLRKTRDEAAQDLIARVLLEDSVGISAAFASSSSLKHRQKHKTEEKISPVASIFVKATGATLLEFENYYQSLLRDRHLLILRAKSTMTDQAVELLAFLKKISATLKRALMPPAALSAALEERRDKRGGAAGAAGEGMAVMMRAASASEEDVIEEAVSDALDALDVMMMDESGGDAGGSAAAGGAVGGGSSSSSREGGVTEFALRQKGQDLFLLILNVSDHLELELSPSPEPPGAAAAAAASSSGESEVLGVGKKAEKKKKESTLVPQITEAVENFMDFLKLDETKSILLKSVAEAESKITMMEALMSKFVASITRIDSEFERSRKLVLDSFAEYMASVAPSPFLLPVSVSIRVHARTKCAWDDVSLKATDALRRVVDFVEEQMEAAGDPVDSYLKDEGESGLKIGVVRPMMTDVVSSGDAKSVVEESKVEEEEEVAGKVEEMEVVTDLDQCVQDLALRPGATLILLTPFILKSEVPRPCFTYDFEKGKGQKTDYYKCDTCSIKCLVFFLFHFFVDFFCAVVIVGVCQACSVQCHAGHALSLFMKDHTPSYACCYCVKKKKCVIENFKTKRKKKK